MQIYDEKKPQNGISMEEYLEKRRMTIGKTKKNEQQDDFILQQTKDVEWFMFKFGSTVRHHPNP